MSARVEVTKSDRVRWLMANPRSWQAIAFGESSQAVEDQLKALLEEMIRAGLYTKWSTPKKSGIRGLLKLAARELARRGS